jgi:hypothetical protein
VRTVFVCQVILSSMLSIACGPLGPLPGGSLDGEVAGTPATSWAFSDAHKTVQLEVRATNPYSVNVWCVEARGRLYVGAGQGASSTWARALLDDSRARIRIGEVIYEITALRVTSTDEIRDYIDSLARKYESSEAALSDFEPTADRPASAVLFRLDPRARSDAA